MKKLHCFRTLFLLLLIGSASYSYADLDKMSLKKAIVSKKITVNAESLGGYCGRCLNLRLQNNTAKDIELVVDPGLIFDPQDTSLQPLVAWGNEEIAVKAGGSEDLVVSTFCGNYFAHSPRKDVRYSYKKQADTNVVKALKYSRKLPINPYTVQRAVWMFMNGQALRNVYSGVQDNETDSFVSYLANVRHEKVPTYFVLNQLNTAPNQPIGLKDSGRIVIPVKWAHKGFKDMQLAIYKADGTIYKTIEGDRVMDKDWVKVRVELKQGKDPKGTYRIKLKDQDHKIWLDEEVKVDFDE